MALLWFPNDIWFVFVQSILKLVGSPWHLYIMKLPSNILFNLNVKCLNMEHSKLEKWLLVLAFLHLIWNFDWVYLLDWCTQFDTLIHMWFDIIKTTIKQSGGDFAPSFCLMACVFSLWASYGFELYFILSSSQVFFQVSRYFQL